MSTTDELLRNNERYATDFDKAELPAAPARHVAVVVCMDARLDVYRMLGLAEGDAHVIRNAGGVVTEDVIRSLAVSQRFLGTREIMIIHHTGCGMMTLRDQQVRAEIEEETGMRPSFTFDSFSDPVQEGRQSIRRIRASPFIANKDEVRAFVYDVDTGRLDEVR